MALVKSDDTIKVHYTGTLDDGKVFETSRQGESHKFAVSGRQNIQGFDEAVVGMLLSESKTVTIPLVPSDRTIDIVIFAKFGEISVSTYHGCLKKSFF